mgnify:CR=1 FL=1
MYTTLISVSELQALSSPVVVVDCSADLNNPAAGRAQFEEQHIAGALFADINTDLATHDKSLAVNGGRHPLPTREHFAQWLSSQGWRVTTFDYRGSGDSRPNTHNGSLRGFKADLFDWTRDYETVIQQAHAASDPDDAATDDAVNAVAAKDGVIINAGIHPVVSGASGHGIIARAQHDPFDLRKAQHVCAEPHRRSADDDRRCSGTDPGGRRDSAGRGRRPVDPGVIRERSGEPSRANRCGTLRGAEGLLCGRAKR